MDATSRRSRAYAEPFAEDQRIAIRRSAICQEPYEGRDGLRRYREDVTPKQDDIRVVMEEEAVREGDVGAATPHRGPGFGRDAVAVRERSSLRGLRTRAARPRGWQNGALILGEASTDRRCLEPVTAIAGFVLTVGFTPDGSMIVTGGTDGTVRLWDADTLKRIGSNLSHDENVAAGAMVVRNDEVEVVSGLGKLYRWDLEPPPLGGAGMPRREQDPDPIRMAHGPPITPLRPELFRLNRCIPAGASPVPSP